MRARRGIQAPASAVILLPRMEILARFDSILITTPLTPASEKSRLLPAPITMTGMFWRLSTDNSVGSWPMSGGTSIRSAGPPMRQVV